MNMKTKKDLVQTLRIEKVSISKENKLFKNYKLNGEYIFRDMKMSDDIGKYDFCDSSISYHRILKTITLNLVYNDTKKQNKQNKVCSLDPGVSNFETCYSENEVIKFGINCNKQIEKTCKEIDIIHSRIDKGYYKDGEKVTINANKRRNLKKALHRKIQYLKNLKNELHNQVINYLVNNYGKIIISPFKTQEMVQKLSSRIARMMNSLSHYRFRMKLEQKCIEHNCQLEVKQEYYTSKTCTRCGYIKMNLGSSKIFNCDRCKLIIERDYNGARNIMLRNNW
jgi:putative transposase